MKKKLTIHLTIISIILGASFGVYKMFYAEKETLWIALAAPLSGPRKAEGDEIKQAVNSYLDKVNQAKWLHGRQIKLRIFDDKNKAKAAMQAASEIAASKDILLVLGHYSSSASIAAGRIYRKNGIPVITASATAGRITKGNNWYFRVVPNNAIQSSFIANYIKSILKKKSVSMISVADGSYASNLAEQFRKVANQIGLALNRDWVADPQPSQMERDLQKIIAELRSVKNPGMIFIAAGSLESAQIISLLKHAISDYAVIGPGSFTAPTFSSAYENYPREQERPGYYTNGIYATTFVLFATANKEAMHFQKEFIARSNKWPSWIGACYYDAILVAVEALKKAEIDGKSNIRLKRNDIRVALTSMNNPEKAVQGLRGPIFFDKNGDTGGALMVGFYQDKKFIPASVQYHLIQSLQDSSATLKEAIKDKTIMVDGKIMKKTQVVYTGIDINEISNLDMQNKKFTADFYLWFRFKNNFDFSGIKFENAVEPVKLDHLFLETKRGDLTIRAFRVRADFKSDFSLHDYPFEQHNLPIRFYHTSLVKNSLVLVPDVLGMPVQHEKNIGKTRLNAVTGWVINNISFYQDVLNYIPGFGIKKEDDYRKAVQYSRFNAQIRIKRNDNSAAVKKFLPLLMIIACLYLIYFMPYEWHLVRLLVILSVLLITGAFHYKYLNNFTVQYITPFEYVLLAVYALLLLAILISILIFIRYSRNGKQKVNDPKFKLMMYVGKIMHPLAALAAWGGAYIR
ncbi:ABC transporter substrate-binding protein [Desulfococcaceae bacterium HSG9]|nr:ABC transporter substrate-binding protein [Desulfococcaceae bacterium HSG9]